MSSTLLDTSSSNICSPGCVPKTKSIQSKRKARINPSLRLLTSPTTPKNSTGGETPLPALNPSSTEKMDNLSPILQGAHLPNSVKGDEDDNGVVHSHPHSSCTPTIYQEHLRFMRWLRMGQFRLARAMAMGSANKGQIEGACSEEFWEAHWDENDEAELESLLINNLDYVYNEAINMIVSYGYRMDEALNAVLRNGHCFGDRDIFFNIIQNAMTCLNGQDCELQGGRDLGFTDLKQLQKQCVADMVSMLRQVRSFLSKGDAMWCLLMCDMNVAQASAMEDFALLPFPNKTPSSLPLPLPSQLQTHSPMFFPQCYADGEAPCVLPVDVSLPQREQGPPPFLVSAKVSHGRDIDRGNSKLIMTQALESLHKLSLSTSLTLETTSGYSGGGGNLANRKLLPNITIQAYPSIALPKPYPCPNPSDFAVLQMEGASLLKAEKGLLEQDGVTRKELERKPQEQDGIDARKNEVVMNELFRRVKEFEGQLRERKEWAHQKAIQAAGRCWKDMAEMKQLKAEQEDIGRLKKAKQTLEESTMKRLTEMEGALRKASAQVDRANAAVRKLETENAEMRAEMEAARLSAAEADSTRLAVSKREKRSSKKAQSWEKQRLKLQEQAADEKRRIAEIQQQLAQVNEQQQQAEMRWRQEEMAKDEASRLAEAERRAKEQLENSARRMEEAWRSKVDINSRRHKDDIKRLESELAQVRKASFSSSSSSCSSAAAAAAFPSSAKSGSRSLSSSLSKNKNATQEEKKHEIRWDHECVMCMCEERLVVFLPCAHQVICIQCNDLHRKQGMRDCPSCRTPIERRICVLRPR